MPTTVLKNKHQISDEIEIGEMEKGDYVYTQREMEEAMSVYAEQNSIAFSQWRSDVSALPEKRQILNLPIKEQYQLFIKENKL